ncbi:restriction endonuclease subunit S [Limibaculum sp. M0105]|uniref:Restriction endonuclease subunit S n=1 Tax=Thermohalobaculum xanthum TaxID=2753746 RepID=A0A8J7MBA5_9RHOB|nr:restriction endonuclease subunit S [Thermohalobaculum xanthum]MBK0401220.1 restriction endonuclease subunit S [Thermohalobaculum xanthum]
MSDHGLPESWASAEIGSLCDLVNGKAFKPSDWTENGLPIVRIQNLNNPDAPFNHYDGDVQEKFLIGEGELLFAWSGTPGTSFGAHVWRGGDAVLNQHIFKVEFDEKNLEKDFFRLAINQRLDELIGKAHGGVGLRHVTKGVFEQTEIAIPPLPEQRRIVDKLDRLSARSTAARHHLARIPILAARAKQAILAKAFRGELTADQRQAVGARNWRYGAAKDLCDLVQSGGTPKKGFTEKAGVPFLKVYNLVNQTVDFDYRSQFVSEQVHRTELRKSVAQPGDVLMNIVGPPLGKVAIVPNEYPEWNVNQAITVFRPGPNISSKWLYYFLRSGIPVESIYHETKGSAGQVNISLSQCRNFTIPTPDDTEQAEIVSRIETAFAYIDRMAEEASRAAHLLDRLDERLLAKAFRGELVPQDPNDEPAEALLARIRATRAAEPKAKRGRRRNSTRAATGDN